MENISTLSSRTLQDLLKACKQGLETETGDEAEETMALAIEIALELSTRG